LLKRRKERETKKQKERRKTEEEEEEGKSTPRVLSALVRWMSDRERREFRADESEQR